MPCLNYKNMSAFEGWPSFKEEGNLYKCPGVQEKICDYLNISYKASFAKGHLRLRQLLIFWELCAMVLGCGGGGGEAEPGWDLPELRAGMSPSFVNINTKMNPVVFAKTLLFLGLSVAKLLSISKFDFSSVPIDFQV